jgi:hypothetical protein
MDNLSMSPTSKIGQISHNRITPPTRTRKRGARPEGKPSRARCRLWLEQLETRVTPSILGTFELDGNAITGDLTSGNPNPPPSSSGSQTTSHDWDQIFTDAGSPQPGSGGASFAKGASSAALAGSFDYDPVNNKNSDIIFTTGGGKDTQPISSWLYKNGSPPG